MLITFDSKAGRVTMFGDVAVHLLKMMGHSGTVPSALLADDVPAALQRLETALQHPPPMQKTAEDEKQGDANAGGEHDERPVSIGQRAFPLLQLLRNAAATKADIMWAREGAAPVKF
jgi:hypothetical protein